MITNIKDIKFLKQAVNQAILSVKKGGFPAGAIIVKDNKIISKGISMGSVLHDPTSHAETSSIRKACRKLKTTDLSGATLYASLQPCILCNSAANWANISRIIYGCRKTADMISKRYYEGNGDINDFNNNNTHKIIIEYLPDFEEEMLQIVSNWELKINQ